MKQEKYVTNQVISNGWMQSVTNPRTKPLVFCANFGILQNLCMIAYQTMVVDGGINKNGLVARTKPSRILTGAGGGI